MTTRNLEHLLAPRSVAVIGASDRPGSPGAAVFRNLRAGGFAGPLWPVNLRHREVAGERAWSHLRELPQAPDLAVICTPPRTVPGLIEELGSLGGKAALVLTAGLQAQRDRRGRSLTDQMLKAARPHLLRILGPEGIGLLVPGLGLNASLVPAGARPGKLAFVSQSGSLAAAVLDWAGAREIGFSHVVAVGERADVDVADLVDYLGGDAGTRAILLYLETIKTPRKFLSAARAAARNKPVIVVKSGRTPQAALAAAAHTGAAPGADRVFDAAVARAGMLRVENLLDLFVAVESLARAPRGTGERLLIVTNSGGAGVLAADAVTLGGAELAMLADATLERFDAVLADRPRANPVDLGTDAPPERYAQALRIAAECEEADAVLLIHAPTALVPADAVAAACLPVAQAMRRPLLSCWLGAGAVEPARRAFAAAGVPGYATPEEAVRAFVQGLTYRRNQEQLMEAPPSTEVDFTPDREAAHTLAADALRARRETLGAGETRRLLAAYGIEAADTRAAGSVNSVLAAADAIGYPVALKIQSPELAHKSEVGGVALDLDDARELRTAASAMLRRVRRLAPHAEIAGFTVQAMARRPGAHELFIGVASDAQFGPVIVFGQGGTASDAAEDRAVALPPLNEALAKELVSRTRVGRLLAGDHDRPAADLSAVCRVLVRMSQLLIDLPELAELQIDPLLADRHGALALDTRVRVQPATAGTERLAIRPYPRELEEALDWRGRRLLLRPIRPDDETRHLVFLQKLDPEDIRMRIFTVRRAIERSELARLTQIDYEREMAFIALVEADGALETLGAVRAIFDADNVVAEFGIVVRSDLKGRGLGRLLLDKMIRYCRSRGTQVLVGDVLSENTGMLGLCRSLGFESGPSDEPDRLRLRLPLQQQSVPPGRA
jgi:acetyltransferase